MESKSQPTQFFCPFCKDYQKITDFLVHRHYHHNDVIPYPETLEQLKTRFEMLGLYDEK